MGAEALGRYTYLTIMECCIAPCCEQMKEVSAREVAHMIDFNLQSEPSNYSL